MRMRMVNVVVVEWDSEPMTVTGSPLFLLWTTFER